MGPLVPFEDYLSLPDYYWLTIIVHLYGHSVSRNGLHSQTEHFWDVVEWQFNVNTDQSLLLVVPV